MAFILKKDTRGTVMILNCCLILGGASLCLADSDSNHQSDSSTSVPITAEIIENTEVTAVLVKENKGLGKLLGKTMKMVSLKKNRSQLPTKPKAKAKKELPPKLFDPQRKESPIRTARLFKIQINEVQTEPESKARSKKQKSTPNGLHADR